MSISSQVHSRPQWNSYMKIGWFTKLRQDFSDAAFYVASLQESDQAKNGV